MGSCLGSHKAVEENEMVNKLGEETNFSEEEIKQFLQKFKRKHPNGKMGVKDLQVMFESVFKEGDASEISEQIMKTFDKDQSGYLDFWEVITALSVSRRGSPADKMKLAFDMIDEDQSGTIDKDELIHLVTALHKMVGITVVHVGGTRDDDTPENHVSKMMQKLDLDQDNQISFDEFCEGVQREPAIARLLTAQTSPEILARFTRSTTS